MIRFFNNLKTLAFLAISVVVFSSCESTSNDTTPSENIPSSYSFSRSGNSSVSFSGQEARLAMLAELETYMKTANTVGTTLDATKLANMYANENNPFSTEYAKQLKDKTSLGEQAYISDLLNKAANASQNSSPGAIGTAGVYAEGPDDVTLSTGYLVDENGFEYTQLVSKGLMGSCFYFNAMDVYLSKTRTAATLNEAIVEGKNYTSLEHYFDEAFGYFGFPVDFNSEDPKGNFWGKYAIARDQDTDSYGAPGIAKATFDAFVAGRYYITEKNYDGLVKQVNIIQDNWEKIIGLTAADYLNKALSSNNPPKYKKVHYLSEAYAFIRGLKFKNINLEYGGPVTERLSNSTKVDEAIALLEGKTLANLTDEEINAIISKLADAFPAGVIK